MLRISLVTVYMIAYGAFLSVLAQDKAETETVDSPALCWTWNPMTDETKWSECNEKIRND